MPTKSEWALVSFSLACVLLALFLLVTVIAGVYGVIIWTIIKVVKYVLGQC